MIGNILYPPLCLHCQAFIKGKRLLLCTICQSLLHFLEPINRCSTCFLSIEGGSVCHHCSQKNQLGYRVAAVFDYQGPAATLVHQLKFANRPHLAKELAAFMLIQLIRLDWPLPDLIVPAPLSITHFFKRGYNQSKLLAKELSQLIEKPMRDILKKSSEGFAQMGQNRAQRELLPQEAISWKKPCMMTHQRILLIDDVMTTGTTLRHSAHILRQGSPASIDALTICLA